MPYTLNQLPPAMPLPRGRLARCTAGRVSVAWECRGPRRALPANRAGRAIAASSAVALAAARAPNPPSREGRLAVSAETADQAGRRGRCLANLTKEAPWCWFVSSMALSPPASREGRGGWPKHLTKMATRPLVWLVRPSTFHCLGNVMLSIKIHARVKHSSINNQAITNQ